MVKSPGMSPEMKRSKLEVFPDDKRKGREPINQEDVDRYVDALTSFHVPEEENMVVVEGDRFKHHPNEDIERYFISSAQWGKPAIPWEIVKPVFLWKLDFVIQSFKKISRQFPADEPAAPPAPAAAAASLITVLPLVFNLEESIAYIMQKAKSFEGFPFTWQRLCELLSTPMKHYNYVEKYVRALDRVINVVTTITVWGAPTDGNDWEMHVDNDVPHLENVFFGTVDEVDAMDQARRLQNIFPDIEGKGGSGTSNEEKEKEKKKESPKKQQVEEEMEVSAGEEAAEQKEEKVEDKEKEETKCEQIEVVDDAPKKEEEKVEIESEGEHMEISAEPETTEQSSSEELTAEPAAVPEPVASSSVDSDTPAETSEASTVEVTSVEEKTSEA